MHQIIKGLWRRSYPRKDSCGIGTHKVEIQPTIDLVEYGGISSSSSILQNTSEYTNGINTCTILLLLLLLLLIHTHDISTSEHH